MNNALQCCNLQFESIANFGAVVDRLGEFQEVLQSSAMSRPSSTDAGQAQSEEAQQPSLIQLVDQPGDQLRPSASTKQYHPSVGIMSLPSSVLADCTC